MHRTVDVLAERSVKEQLDQLRQFYTDKGISIDKTGPENLQENIAELLAKSSFIGELASEKDVEYLLNAIFSLVITLAENEALSLVQQFCQLVSTFKGHGFQSNAGVAVRVLSNFLHSHNGMPKLQLIEFKYLLELSGRAHLTQSLEVGNIEKINEYSALWALNVEQKREILRLLHTALIQDQRHDCAAEVMTALLKTYDDSDADKAKHDARECVRTAVIDPKSFSFDHLLGLSAVKRLEKTDPLIHEILTIFVKGRLQDYRNFVRNNSNFVLEQLKVEDEATLDKKIKMLTLISLAEENQVLNLNELKLALDINEEEMLEEFLIDAIRLNAISGKINEVKNELVVTSFQYRIFGRPQWELLQKKMTTLLKNLNWIHARVSENNFSNTNEGIPMM